MDNFSKFGKTFQTKVITCLLFDRQFFQQIHDILKSEYFDQKSCEWLIDQATTYYRKYKVVPTLDAYKILLDDVKESDDTLYQTIVETLRAAVRYQESSDLQFVKDETLEFCKNQVMKLAILHSVELLNNGKYEEIKKEISNALAAGSEKDTSHKYLEDIDVRYEVENRNPIPTPWPIINSLMDDGLGSGELGLVIAPGGAGKSWILASLAAHTLLQGKNAMYITLELRDTYIGRRVDSILTGIPFKQLSDDISIVKERLSQIHQGRLEIQRFKAKRTTIVNLESHIERSMALGFKPDVIVVDYADLLKPLSPAGGERRFELEDIVTDLRELGIEYSCPVWTATQSNRGSINLDIIEADSVSEAYNKVFVPDFVFSHSRGRQDKLNGTARWHIIKNRMGADGMTFPVQFDADSGKIVVHSENSPAGQQQLKLMSSNKDTAEKNRMKNVYQDMVRKSPKPVTNVENLSTFG